MKPWSSTWWTAGRSRCPWPGTPAWHTAARRSELGGASSVREKAFTGPIWTRTSVSTGCSPAVGLVKHRHPFDGGSSVERLANPRLQPPAAEVSIYMRVFLEPQVGRHWQTRWDDLRSRGLLPHRRKYTLALTSLYVGLALTCMVLAAAFWRPMEWRVFALAAVPLAGVTIAAIAAVIRAFSTPVRESYAVAWQLLKDSETPLGNGPSCLTALARSMTHPIHRVARFSIVGPYILTVSFTDGTEQRIDFRPVLHGSLFAPLQDLAIQRGHAGPRGRHPCLAERRRLRPGDASRLAGRVRGVRRKSAGVGGAVIRTAGYHANGADAPVTADGARLIRNVDRP